MTGLDVFGHQGPRIQPLLLAAVAVVMMSVAAAAAFLPARRAARVDPMIVLRHE